MGSMGLKVMTNVRWGSSFTKTKFARSYLDAKSNNIIVVKKHMNKNKDFLAYK